MQISSSRGTFLLARLMVVVVVTTLRLWPLKDYTETLQGDHQLWNVAGCKHVGTNSSWDHRGDVAVFLAQTARLQCSAVGSWIPWYLPHSFHSRHLCERKVSCSNPAPSLVHRIWKTLFLSHSVKILSFLCHMCQKRKFLLSKDFKCWNLYTSKDMESDRKQQLSAHPNTITKCHCFVLLFFVIKPPTQLLICYAHACETD